MKRILFLLAGGLALYFLYIVVSLLMLPPVTELADKKYNTTIQVKDWQGKYHPFVVGPKNRRWTPSGSIPPEMKWAVILAEDSNFYKHEGIDVKAIKQAIKYDLEKKSFKRGASTITQQIAKNLFLSREKTITRKLKELYLAWRMEQELTKGRIIELYLNVVELGPMVYGIGHGAQYYFGKHVSALTPRECAFLAAMLPGPRVAYNPYKNLRRVVKRSDMILKLMRQKGVISDDEYRTGAAEQPNIAGMQRKIDQAISAPPVFSQTSSVSLPAKTGEKAAPPEQKPEQLQKDVASPTTQPAEPQQPKPLPATELGTEKK